MASTRSGAWSCQWTISKCFEVLRGAVPCVAGGSDEGCMVGSILSWTTSVPFGVNLNLMCDASSCVDGVVHSARDDEQVAAALGYTVHLLLLASKYLEVSVCCWHLLVGAAVC